MKKAVEPMMLVSIIIGAVSLFFAAVYIVPPMITWLKEGGGSLSCTLTFLLQKAGQKIEGCEMLDITITPEMLSKLVPSAEKEYNALKGQGRLRMLEDPFNPRKNPHAMEAWALYRFIAQETTKCFDRTLGGKALETPLPAWVGKVVCVLCDRITLTEDAKALFRNTPFMPAGWHFDQWMKTVPFRKTTYGDYIAQAISKGLIPDPVTQDMFNSMTTYSPTLETSMAIMIANIPGSRIGGKDIRWLQIYPYDEIATRNIRPELTRLFGGDIKCETFIGI